MKSNTAGEIAEWRRTREGKDGRGEEEEESRKKE